MKKVAQIVNRRATFYKDPIRAAPEQRLALPRHLFIFI